MSVSGGLARVSCRATGVTRILPLCWEEGAPFQATRGVAGVSGSCFSTVRQGDAIRRGAYQAITSGGLPLRRTINRSTAPAEGVKSFV